MRILVSLIVLCSLVATSAFARPAITERVTTYAVTGSTPAEIRRSLDANGPNGNWGNTTWRVTWSEHCRVSLRLQYIRPELANRASFSPEYLAAWDQMIVALVAHQKLYADIGRGAAVEIDRRGCGRADAIMDKWLEENRRLDTESQANGVSGMVLP